MMRLNTARQPPLYHAEERTLSLAGCEDIAMIPSEELVDVRQLLRASFTTTGPVTDLVQSEDASDGDGTGTLIVVRGSRVGKQLDVRMWEVIRKEIMDCHEPSQLHQPRGYSNVGT